MRSPLLNKRFFAINLSHFTVDVYISQRAILLAYLALQTGQSNAWLGWMTTLGMLCGGLLQPVFGWLGDRYGNRWLIAGGLIWVIAFFSIGLLVSPLAAAIFLVIFNFGSGAYHPAGTVEATRLGRDSGMEHTAASIFFLAGQFGFVVGPILGGALLDHNGPIGLIWFAICAIPVAIFAAVVMKDRKTAVDMRQPVAPLKTERIPGWMVWVIFAVLLLQAWAQQNLTSFIPKYLGELGQPASIYGLLSALYMAGSGFGNLLGGRLADRFSKRPVIVGTLLLAVLPQWILGVTGFSAWWYALVPLAGLATGASFSVLVVTAQNNLPVPISLASGLTLGWVFLSGAFGAYASGLAVDVWGFPLIFLASAGMCLLAGLCAMSLKLDRKPAVSLQDAE